MIDEYDTKNNSILEKIYQMLIDNLLIIYPNKKRDEFDNKESHNKFINSLKKEDNYKIITYTINEETVAFLSYNIIENNLWISEVQVKNDFKRKGILKKLLRYFSKNKLLSNYNEIYIHINSNNKISQKVFTHIGFKLKENTIYTISSKDLIIYSQKND